MKRRLKLKSKVEDLSSIIDSLIISDDKDSNSEATIFIADCDFNNNILLEDDRILDWEFMDDLEESKVGSLKEGIEISEDKDMIGWLVDIKKIINQLGINMKQIKDLYNLTYFIVRCHQSKTSFIPREDLGYNSLYNYICDYDIELRKLITPEITVSEDTILDTIKSFQDTSDITLDWINRLQKVEEDILRGNEFAEIITKMYSAV